MASAQERIRGAALELMGRKGVAGTTTQDIASRARCSQAAIYKYWEGKEMLALELFDQAQAALIGRMEEEARRHGAPEERALGALHGLVAFAREEPNAYAFLFQIFHSDFARWLTRHPVPRDIILREVESAIAAGRIPAGTPQVKTALILGMAIRSAFFERQNLLDAPPREADALLWRSAASILEA